MDQKLLIGIAVGLALGGVGGWFLGSWQAMQSVNKQTAEMNASQQQAQGADATVNAVGNVQTNPYENVKTNPFE